MSIISFTYDKNYIYVLIYYILEIGGAILEYFDKKNQEYNNEGDNNNEDNNKGDNITNFNISSQYIKIVLLIFADLLFLPFFIYTKCYLKKDKKKVNNSKNDIKLIYNDSISRKCKKIVLYSFLISILDLISRSIYFLFFLFYINREKELINLPKRYNMDYILAIDICFRYFFSRIIIKTKIYRHHKYSMYICLVGFILFIAFDCFDIDYKNINNIIYLLIISIRAILFPLEDIINQILLSKYFLLPHYLMTYRGLIELTFFSLITIILISLKVELFGINILSFYNFIYLIFFSAKAFSLMQIIYIFNSQYVSFLITSETLGSTIIKFIEEGISFFSFMLEAIPMILVIFGTLMYNEIIIINLFGLETKTKKFLTLEQDKEVNDHMIALNEKENENENDVNMDK